MITLILSLAQGAFCAYILAIAVIVYTDMRAHTRFGIRAAYIMIGTAALDGMLTCTAPNFQACLMAGGVAFYLANSERRGRHAT